MLGRTLGPGFGGLWAVAAAGAVAGGATCPGDANEMDDICAIAGIHAAGLRADSDFFDDPVLMRALSIHKTPPLVDPRKPQPSSAKKSAAAGARRTVRNGSARRNGPQAAKSGP